jgi:hypothetical protein
MTFAGTFPVLSQCSTHSVVQSNGLTLAAFLPPFDLKIPEPGLK